MMTIRENRELRAAVRKIIGEAFDIENLEYERQSRGEKKEQEHKKDYYMKYDKKKNSKKRANKNAESKSKRSIVLKWLKDPALNCAQIMRELWHPEDQEEEASKRSYFYKCMKGEVNKQTGVPYSFTDEDITSLYKIKSDSKE